jgi:RNA polymerase sigma factor for flagellar operon FliA
MNTALSLDQRVARDAQVARYAPLVQRVAQRIIARLPANIELGDLLQAGMMGLMDALNNQPEGEGAGFAAYAGARIRGAILDELRAQDWLPRRARAKEQSIAKAIARLEQKKARPPSDEEIAQELGWSLSAYHAAVASGGNQLLYLEDLAEGHDAYAGRYLRDEQASAEAILSSAEFARDLEAGITQLPEKEQLVLALYYQEDLTLKEVGEVLDISESRVSQLLRQATLRLRSMLLEWSDAS